MVINKLGNNITKIQISGKEQTFLLLSDVHFDSKSCERELLKSKLDEALEKNAIILVNGDFFDMMQSRNDKRGMKGSLRKEYLGDNYFDLVIEDAYEFLKPYAKNILVMADGNHETAITKNYETNPLERLCYMLRKEGGSNTQHTGYQGWIVLSFTHQGNNAAYYIKMHHGSGGNARVTKGIIEHNRMSTYVEGADLIWLGHTHTQYCVHSTIEKITSSNVYNVDFHKVYHIRTGCWKQEYKEGGWAVEKGFGPSEIGGYWVELSFNRPKIDGVRKTQIETKVYST
jgi:UDP-2,3-diacylglucosamine pyrophosphatase LpxH